MDLRQKDHSGCSKTVKAFEKLFNQPIKEKKLYTKQVNFL